MTRAVATRPLLGVLTNPHSRKNKRNPERARALADALRGIGVVRATESKAEIAAVVREFREMGLRYWIADGGDGALFWMLNSAIDELCESDDELAEVVPFAVPANGGTIDFVAKRAGIRGRAEGLAKAITKLNSVSDDGNPNERPECRFLPSLRISGRRRESLKGPAKSFSYIGFSAALGGVGNRFFDELYAQPDRNAAVIAKIMAQGSFSTVCAKLFSRIVPDSWLAMQRRMMKPNRLAVSVDGESLPYNAITCFNVSAFDVDFGSGLRFFPLAKNGKLHVMVGEPTAFEVFKNVPRMFLGKPMKAERFFDDAVTRIEAKVIGDELLSPIIDGEPIHGVESLLVEPGPKVRFAAIDGRE